MGNHFDDLVPRQEIPWATAASFFQEIREVTKTAASPSYEMDAKERRALAIRNAKSQGVLSGIRSSVAGDVAHGSRIHRTRGERVGKGLGTGAGAVLGAIAARKGGAAGKAVGALTGALAGRGLGSIVGKESDLARLKKKFRPKKKTAEMDKYTEKSAAVQRVRDLLKLAAGAEPLTDAENGPAGVAPTAGEVEPGALTQGKVPAVPQQKAGGNTPDTPEVREKQRAMEMLEQEAQADQASEVNEADYYRQLAHEATQGLEEQGAQLQEAQGQAEQAGQQAQMAQAQADQAVQQSAAQAQQSAMQNQQLSAQLEATGQEAMAGKEHIMQMRQSMQNYREQLQQIALEDPVAMAGPSPEEQGMPQTPEEQQMMEQQQAEQGMPPEAAQGEMPEMLQADEAEAVPAEAAPKPKPKKKPEKKDEGKSGVTVNVEKTSGVLPFLKAASLRERGIGALVGGAGAAALQARSDRKGPSGKSERELVFKAKLKALKSKKDPSLTDQYKKIMYRAYGDLAEVHRKNPKAAMAMSGAAGAATGAMIAPTAAQIGRQMFRR